MKKLNLWKRTLAGLLSLLVVSGYAVPAAYSGGLFARTAIVAEADDVISIKMEGSTLKIGGNAWTHSSGSAGADWYYLNSGTYRLDSDITTDQRIGVPSGATVTLNLNGHSINHRQSEGDAIEVDGTLTITGTGNVINNNFGSCVLIRIGGTLNLQGGTITNNGGSDKSRCEGVNISGTMNMTGGSLSNNTKAIRLDDDAGTFNMSGGSITGNTYGVWVENSDATVNFSGNPIVNNNLYNVYLKSGRKVNVSGALGNSANICVDMESTGTFTSGGYAAQSINAFHSDKDGFVVLKDGNELKLGVHNHSFNYTPSGATITAACSAAGCTDPVTSASLTIVAPTLTTYGGSGSALATLTGLDDFNSATKLNIAASDIKYVGKGSTSYPESSTAPTNAGTYTAKITAGGQTASVDYTIAKASISPTVTMANWTYGGTASTPSVSGNTGGGGVTYSYSGTGSTSYGPSSTKPTNAGTYRVTATIAGTTNYNGGTATADFTISKGTNSVTNNPAVTADADAYYRGGDSINLIATAPTGYQGTLSYKVNNGEWSTTPPTASAKGNYTVYYKVDGGTNYENIGQTTLGTVTVANRTLNYNDLSEGDMVYAGDTIVPSGSGRKICTSGSSFGHGDYDSYTVNGTYAVTHKGYFGTTYENVSLNPPNLIAATYSITANTPTYNRAAQQLVSVSGNGGTIHYRVGEEGSFSTTAPTATKAGNYTVYWYSDANDTYRPVGSDAYPQSVSVTIAPYDISTANGRVSASTNDQDYTGSAITTAASGLLAVIDTANSSNHTLVQGTDYTVEYASNTDASNDTATITIKGKGNYSGTITRTFNIRARLDLSDDRTNDSGIRLSNQVRKAITKIEYDADGNGTFATNEGISYSSSSLPNSALFYLQGKTIKVYSKAKLAFTTDTATALSVTEDYDNSGYTYTFTIPAGVNVVTAKRVYRYTYLTDGNVLTGTNEYSRPMVPITIATLNAEDFEYLETVDSKKFPETAVDHVCVTVNEAYEKISSSRIEYLKAGETDALESAPTAIGAYTAKAYVKVDGTDRELTKNFNITRRNYALHSGTDAPADNKITAAILNFSGDNKVTYNNAVQTPVVTITDTKRAANDQTLVRGRDYELYKLNGTTYTKVDAANDTTAFGQTNAGTYIVYVKFIGNYINSVNNAEEYVPVTWTIEKADITAEMVTNPNPNTLTYNTEAQALVAAGSVSHYDINCGTFYYREGATGNFSTTIPTKTDAGVYNVYWYIKGDQNHNDYGSATNPKPTVSVTLSPKSLTAEQLTVELPNESHTYNGSAQTFTGAIVVKDGTHVIPAAEYAFTYDTNINAGTANIKVSDNLIGTTIGTGTGNYTITEKTVTFPIAKASPQLSVALKNASITYDGAAVNTTDDFTVSESNTETNDVTIKWYADVEGEKGDELTDGAPVNAGTYWIEASIAETTNFLAETKTIKFTIEPKSISGVTITVTGSPMSDGTNGKTPNTVSVVDGVISSTALTANTDYSVSYSNNVHAGTAAVVTIQGQGNYKDTATANFEVLSKLDLSAVKDMITGITYKTNNTAVTLDTTTGIYGIQTAKQIEIVSQGKLKFTGTGITAVENDTNAGYKYTFTIPAETDLVTAVHHYNYEFQQTDQIDGSILILGRDVAIKGNTEWVDVATFSVDEIHYLDNYTAKVKLTKAAPAGLTFGTESCKFAKETGDTGMIVSSKPSKIGTYHVNYTFKVTDSDSTEDISVNTPIEVLKRVYGDNTAEIIPAVTYTNGSTTPFVYNGSAQTPTITVTDSKLGETNNALVKGTDYQLGYIDDQQTFHVFDEQHPFAQTHAGAYTVAINFIGNYTGVTTKEWTINPKNVTEALAATGAAVMNTPAEGLTYDGTAQTPTATLKVDNGTTTLVPETDYTITYSNNINAGTATATISPKEGSNYTFDEFTRDFTIKPKPVTITGLGAANKVYDGGTVATPTGNATVNGKVGTDDVTVTAGSASFADKNVGTGKTVTFSGYSLTGTAAANYQLSEQPTSVTANIIPKDVIVTPNAAQKTYGEADPAFNYTVDTLVEGDTLTGALSRAEGGNAGTYAFTIGTLANSNYTLTLATGDNVPVFTINKAAQNVTVKAKNSTRNGSDLELVTVTGTLEEKAVMKYYVGETAPARDSADWQNEIPKNRDTGKYKVWYFAAETTNYQAIDPGYVTAQISAPYSGGGGGYSGGGSSYSDQTWTLNMNDYEYDGTAHKPTINGTPYGNVTYTYYDLETNTLLSSAPTAVGRYQVEAYASGNGSYNSSSDTATYSITKASISNATATFAKSSYDYTGSEITPVLTVKIGSKVLTAGTDYTVSGDVKATASGNYTVTITGVGNYKDTTTASWSIAQEAPQVQPEYSVTVTNGTVNGSTSGTYEKGTVLVAKAGKAAEGHKFAYWKKNGTTASYNESYTFPLSSDTVLEAVYTLDTDQFDTSGNGQLDDFSADKENNKLNVTVLHNVPTDCTIKFAGIVATSDASKLNELTKITATEKKNVNGCYVRGITSDKHTVKFTWTKNEVTADQTWYIRSYLVYIDGNGQEQIYYGDLIRSSLEGYDIEIEERIVGTSNMDNVIRDKENRKLSFEALLTVQADCKIKFAGVVATSDATKLDELTKITAVERTEVNDCYVRGKSSDKHTVKFTWTKTKVTDDETWYVRSYLVYEDANGKIQIVYGDLTTATLN